MIGHFRTHRWACTMLALPGDVCHGVVLRGGRPSANFTVGTMYVNPCDEEWLRTMNGTLIALDGRVCIVVVTLNTFIDSIQVLIVNSTVA